jgi:hypothetical protein
MTPGEAAVILSIDVDASMEDVDRAYRAHARRAHPDLLVGANHDQILAAEAEFVRITEARAVLRGRTAGHSAAPPGEGAGSGGGARDTAAAEPGSRYYYDTDFPRAPYEGSYEQSLPRAPSSWLIVTWALLMLGACAVSYVVGPVPGSVTDLFLRLLPLTALSVLYALTGRGFLLGAAVVLVAVTAVMTFLLASFGSLLTIELLLVPFFGLVSAGRRRRRIREFNATQG